MSLAVPREKFSFNDASSCATQAPPAPSKENLSSLNKVFWGKLGLTRVLEPQQWVDARRGAPLGRHCFRVGLATSVAAQQAPRAHGVQIGTQMHLYSRKDLNIKSC